jgi:hypothetical protein
MTFFGPRLAGAGRCDHVAGKGNHSNQDYDGETDGQDPQNAAGSIVRPSWNVVNGRQVRNHEPK